MYPTPVGLALIEMIAERPDRKATRPAKRRNPRRSRRRSFALWHMQVPARIYE
jgi:hypothetical protein